MAIKERRIKCATCGERETVIQGERGPVSAYCDVCREERQREQTRARVQAMRQRQRLASPLSVTDTTGICTPSLGAVCNVGHQAHEQHVSQEHGQAEHH